MKVWRNSSYFSREPLIPLQTCGENANRSTVPSLENVVDELSPLYLVWIDVQVL